ASAAIRYGDERVGMVRGGVLLDTTWLARLAETSGVDLILCDADGRALAGTRGVGDFAPGRVGDRSARVSIGGRSYLAASAPIALGTSPYPRLVGLFPTAIADETVAALGLTALLLGLLGVVLAIGLGMLWSLQVSRPVERLARFSERISRGEWDEPLALESVRELQTLVTALERMRADLGGYRERLRTTERQAAYGQMARQVAHEIKNPLTPIAVAAADLRRSYEQRRPEFPEILDQAVRTIEEEVHRLTGLLREFSELGRFPDPRPERCDVAGLLADLGALYTHEIAAGRLAIAPPPAGTAIDADRGQIRQALINLVQNGLEAVGDGGRVTLGAHAAGDVVEIVVSDDGPGLTPNQRQLLFVPGFTTKTHGSGLGLALVEHIVGGHHGAIAVVSEPGHGATFRIRLPLARGV
ncbi:MAG: sensor histidine kinase, partial [Candidatus Eisenbacteria bacterium]